MKNDVWLFGSPRIFLKAGAYPWFNHSVARYCVLEFQSALEYDFHLILPEQNKMEDDFLGSILRWCCFQNAIDTTYRDIPQSMGPHTRAAISEPSETASQRLWRFRMNDCDLVIFNTKKLEGSILQVRRTGRSDQIIKKVVI